MSRIKLAVVLFLCVVLSGSFAGAAELEIPTVDIVIDAGHGGVDSGTTYGEVAEKDINLQVAKILYHELAKSGYRVILNRVGDYALSDENQWLNNPSRHLRDLAQRKHLAVEFSPQIMISLHTNWASNPKRRGPVVLYQKNNQGFMLADIIQHALNRFYGTNKEPVSGKKYYLLKHDSCPAIIVEMGFISNAADRELMTKPESQQQIAQAIKIGIDEYFLLTSAALNK